MTILVNGLIVGLTFVAMEGVAWLAHRYVMHGFMWWFHQDHHNHQPGFFEKNDAFFLIFAFPSAYFFMTGTLHGDARVWIGMGILLYGIAYVVVHDVFIHQRVRRLRKTQSAYWMAVRKAHLVHHKHLGPENGECFGMLLAPPRYYHEAKAALKSRRREGSLV